MHENVQYMLRENACPLFKKKYSAHARMKDKTLSRPHPSLQAMANSSYSNLSVTKKQWRSLVVS
jgi:hypothetical protein